MFPQNECRKMISADKLLNTEPKANQSETSSVSVLRLEMKELYETLVFNSPPTGLIA
jgi:hypothetical protein